MSHNLKVGDYVRRINNNFTTSTGTAIVGCVARVTKEPSAYNIPVTWIDSKGKAVSQGWTPENAEPIRRKVDFHAELSQSRLDAGTKNGAPVQDTPKLQWTAIVGEKSRTYHFPDGSKFTVENVVRLCVRPTNHRLVTADGDKFVIPGKFIAIAIDAETWSA